MRKTVGERFWAKVVRGDDCWEWNAGTTKYGYGTFWDGTKQVGAHVYSFLLHGGVLADGQIVLHSCDHPPCTNPAHLRAGTHADNTADKMARGRHRSGVRKYDACPKGHQDWYINDKTGWKYCRPCRADYARTWRKRRHS
jgi:hypothetical protein